MLQECFYTLHVAPLPADSNIVQPSVLSVGGSKAKYRYFRVHDGFKSVRKRPDSEAERGRYCELLLADPPATALCPL